VLAIRRNPKSEEWTLSSLRWGLIPNWSKDEKIAYRTINARVETVDTAPSYREAYKKRRCLIPADGFYEWKRTETGKQPYSIQRKDDTPFCFAGLWEGWKRPGTEDWVRTRIPMACATGCAVCICKSQLMWLARPPLRTISTYYKRLPLLRTPLPFCVRILSQKLFDQPSFFFQLVDTRVNFLPAEVIQRHVLNNLPCVTHSTNGE
jgi:SOS response associated peptidase (SRAP)